MIENYKLPILNIKLPLDEPPVETPPEDDLALYPKRFGSPAPDSYVRIISGEITPLQICLTRQFQAKIYFSPGDRLIWTVEVGEGTIDNNGLYTGPCTLPGNPTVTVCAASTLLPELRDCRTFMLTELVRNITFRLINGLQVAVGGSLSFWRLPVNSLESQTAQPVAAAGATTNMENGQPVDVSQVAVVTLHLALINVQFNGQTSAIFTAIKLSDTLYVVTLVDDDHWTYFNTSQTYTATCPSGTFGPVVTSTKAAGTFSSTESPAAANALALAAAQAEAESMLVCGNQTMLLDVVAVDADGKISLKLGAPGFYGNLRWVLTIGAVRRVDGSGTFLDPGNWIKNTELGAAYLAENLTFYTNNPEAEAFPTLVFYFSSIDPRWAIGNSAGDTWLIDVTASVTATDPVPNVVLQTTWKKYLLI